MYHSFALGEKGKLETYVSQIEALSRDYGGHYREVNFNAERDKLTTTRS
ncbi:MAG: hypothetical protein ACK5LM_06640 [Lactovum sp.]